MHIVLNAHLISDQRGYRNAGVSIYSRRLLAALGELAQQGETDHRFTALAHAADLDAPGVTVSPGSVQLDRPLARIAWEQGVLPFTLARLRGDLVHGLVNVLPLATRLPGVVTVHDLSFVRFPRLFPPFKRFYLTALCRASVRRAQRVLAVSHQTAEDVTRFFGVDPQRIVIAPNGVAARFTPGTGQNAAFRAEQGLPARYWLFVGTLEPRKNLPMLLEAFARWRQAAAPVHQAVQLIIAGGKGWAYDDIFAQVTRLGLHESVRFPGFIPDASLPDWYRGAELFLYPSTFEGFGLPVAEAMACGTPVLCSDAPGVREVAGDAAWRLPPNDVDAWVAALGGLATDPTLRAALSAAGMTRAAQYTWRATALATLDAYAQAAAR